MPVLKNAHHERFAQAIAEGKTADEAYVIAGYEENRGNARRLKANEAVRKRIEEILTASAQRVGITAERIITELAKIGFADIRKAVEWGGAVVTLLGSDKIDEATAAAIAEVRQSPTGGLSIKFHDKQAALVNLGKHLGLFVERKIVDVNVNPEQLSDAELAAAFIEEGRGEDFVAAPNHPAKPH